MRFRFSRPELVLQAPCRKRRLFPGYNAFRLALQVHPRGASNHCSEVHDPGRVLLQDITQLSLRECYAIGLKSLADTYRKKFVWPPLLGDKTVRIPLCQFRDDVVSAQGFRPLVSRIASVSFSKAQAIAQSLSSRALICIAWMMSASVGSPGTADLGAGLSTFIYLNAKKLTPHRKSFVVTQRSMSCSAAYFRRSLSSLWRKRRTADDFVAEKREKRGK